MRRYIKSGRLQDPGRVSRLCLAKPVATSTQCATNRRSHAGEPAPDAPAPPHGGTDDDHTAAPDRHPISDRAANIMNVLVLGAYGLIGQAVAGRLLTGGAPVVGLARSARRGRATLPTARWIEADISHLLTPADWAPYLDGIDAVVNAAGALQSGRNGEDLSRLQRDAIVALIEASETAGVTRFVQISAPGAGPTASTTFLAP